MGIAIAAVIIGIAGVVSSVVSGNWVTAMWAAAFTLAELALLSDYVVKLDEARAARRARLKALRADRWGKW